MKTKYLAVLIAAMGSSLSFGASIDGLDAAYSKNLTVYDGTSGAQGEISGLRKLESQPFQILVRAGVVGKQQTYI